MISARALRRKLGCISVDQCVFLQADAQKDLDEALPALDAAVKVGLTLLLASPCGTCISRSYLSSSLLMRVSTMSGKLLSCGAGK